MGETQGTSDYWICSPSGSTINGRGLRLLIASLRYYYYYYYLFNLPRRRIEPRCWGVVACIRQTVSRCCAAVKADWRAVRDGGAERWAPMTSTT